MTINQSLYISFNNCEVEVITEDIEILRAVNQLYKNMLVSIPSNIICTLKVGRIGSEYLIYGNDSTIRENRSLKYLMYKLDFEIIQSLIIHNPNYLFLHAGAASASGRAVLISGESGRGKSTLISLLCEAGWEYISDEVLPIDLKSGTISSFPRTMYVRQYTENILSKQQLKTEAIKQIYDPKVICQNSVPIGAIVLPLYKLKGETEFELCSSSITTIELALNCLNITEKKNTAFIYLCNLAESLPVYRLAYNNRESAVSCLAKELDNLWPTNPSLYIN